MFYKTNLLVLNKKDVGDIDLEVEGISEKFGKITLIAKGGKKSLHRFVNTLELFNELEVWMSSSRLYGKFILESADVKRRFINMRKDWKRFLVCEHFSKFLLSIVRPFERYDSLYKTVFSFYSYAESSSQKDLLKFLLYSEIFILQKEGVMPVNIKCVRCSKVIKGEGVFHSKGGGFFCTGCHKEGMRLSKATMKVLENLFSHSEIVERLKLTRIQMIEIGSLLNIVMRMHLGMNLTALPEIFETFFI
jgi:DNA repair protein RecO (recombination protein O)